MKNTKEMRVENGDLYIAPSIEVIEVVVERGFEASPPGVPGGEDLDDGDASW